MGLLAEKKTLTLEACKQIADAAERAAAEQGWKVVIAVVDDGGHLIYLQRLDDAQVGSVEVAQEKARCAVKFKRPTKAFSELLAGGNLGLLRMPGVLPAEGGVPLAASGQVVGAIGVSGVTSQQDGVIAQAGVEAFQNICA